MIGQLVVKEVREHQWVAIGTFMLGVATFLAFVEMWLRHEPPTALVAPTSFAWSAGPLVAAYTARRLFVLEHEQRTIQLLRSLPVSPALVTATKFILGLLFNLALNLMLLWLTAWAIRYQEILTADWVWRLSAQVATYIFAWYALACFHAQLGAYRFASWVVFLVALMTFDNVVENPTRNLFWTASLADDIETTRYATPWDTVTIGLAWGFGAMALTMFLANFRGGTRVDAWFAPMSGRRRAEVTGLTIALLMGLDVVSQTKAQPRLETVDAGTLVVTHDPELDALATELEADLQRLQSFGVRALPRVLLRIRRDYRSEAVLTEIMEGGDALVVGVRADAPKDERVRLIVTDILVGQSGAHWERVAHVGVWAWGFAPFALKHTNLSTTAARLADASPALLDDFEALRRRFGRRGAEAAGWLAWQAVDQLGGKEAVAALATALFTEPRSQSGWGLVVARRIRPLAILQSNGVSQAALHEAWSAAVVAHRQAHPDLPRWSLAPARLERPPGRLPTLVWEDLPVALDQHQVELWWSVAPDLYPHPVPQSSISVAKVDRIFGAQQIFRDPRLRIVSTWVIDGEVVGWAEVPRP